VCDRNIVYIFDNRPAKVNVPSFLAFQLINTAAKLLKIKVARQAIFSAG
jgi:hypothetical protein